VEFAVEIVSDPGGDGVYGTSDDVVDAEATQLLAETPWVVADGSAADLDAAEGSVRTTWMVDPDALNTTLRLTATGFGADGVKSTLDDEVAITSFTDGPQNLLGMAQPARPHSEYLGCGYYYSAIQCRLCRRRSYSLRVDHWNW